MPAKLSINLNKVALIRNQRHVGYPSVIGAARTVIASGAHGITVHPRPDERHIRHSDVYELAEMLVSEGHGPSIEFNIEGNPFPDYMKMVHDVRPAQATLVPDSPDAATSDHGWDIPAERERLKDIVTELKEWGVRVSLFMDADPDAMPLAAEVGADRVELYTGPYAESFGTSQEAEVTGLYARTAQAAIDAGLGVNAGHDLTYQNLPRLVSALPRLDEVSIGHAFTSDALWLGFDKAVKTYLAALGY